MTSPRPKPPAPAAGLGEHRLVAAIGLGGVERLVGGSIRSDQSNSATPRHAGDADADGRDSRILRPKFDLAPDVFGDHERFDGRDARQQHREFLAAEPRRAIAGTLDRVGDADRDADQHLVAGLVAIVVVVGFEMVGVDHQQRDRRLAAHRAPPFGIDLGIEPAPVLQAGERVGGRQFLELVLGLRAAADLARQE